MLTFNGSGGMYKIAERLEALTGAKKAKKKTHNWTDYVLPSLGAAGAGVGAAGLGAAYGIAGDAQADFVQRKLDSATKPARLPGDTDFTHYHDVLSAAASLKPFGIPVGEIMTQLRSSPAIMAKANVPPSYVVKTPLERLESRTHYDAFRKGPISAYFHQAHPNVRGMAEGARPEFDKAWRTFLQEELDTPVTSYVDPHEIDTDLIPHDRQMRFLRKYHKELPPKLQEAVRKYETGAETYLENVAASKGLNPAATKAMLDEYAAAESTGTTAAFLKKHNIVEPAGISGPAGGGLRAQMGNYAAPAQGALMARNKLKNIGITATGATAGGALGYYLHQALSGVNPKKGLTASKLLATLGGAGLGGLAAYYGGTNDGRQAALNKLLSVAPG
jgi:hypothetical protein